MLKNHRKGRFNFKLIKLARLRKIKQLTALFGVLVLYNHLNAQCAGADVLNGTQINQAAPSTCNQSFIGNSSKYKLQSTYTPTNNADPVITVKLVIHVITPTVQIPQAWNSSNGQWNGLATLQNRYNTRLSGNAGRYSILRNASYTVPGYTVDPILDSKIQYEVVGYYFYPSNQYYYLTANGAPQSASNPQAYNSSNVMAWIEQNHPTRLSEGLPVLLMQDGPHKKTVNSSILGNIPFIVTGHSCGNSAVSENGNGNASARTIKHELGHALGLLHPYYGGTNPCGYPGPGSCCPETYNTSSAHPNQLDCSNMDYLFDLLPLNNPSAIAYSFPTPSNCPNPPINNSCNSVYENNDTTNHTTLYTNNIMADNALSKDTGWISPLQMGRRIRSMHLRADAYGWNGVSNWGNVRAFAKEAVSGHASTWDINTNQSWEFDIQMYKDIVVKAGQTLTIKCKVAMATDGKIIVEKGAKLIIDAGEVTGWCKKTPVGSNTNYPLWAGIEVAGNPAQNQLINNTTGLCTNQGIVEVKNGGIVSYAQKGIITSLTSTAGVWQNNTSGGIVIADGANFLNNIYDIIFYKYQLGNATSKVINSNFKTTSLIGSYSSANTQIVPKEHIKLYQNWGLNIQGCTFECASGIYNPANNGAGIYATDSYFKVDQFCAIPGCTSGTRTKFINLQVGAWIDNFNALYFGQIQHCDFTNNVRAAIAENSDYLLFAENSLSMPNGCTGLYAYKSKYYDVRNNSFAGTSKNGEVGVVCYGSGNGTHKIYRNSFSTLGAGIIGMDDNGGTGSNPLGLKMNCNDFNPAANNSTDIALTTFLSMPTVDPLQSTSPAVNGVDPVRNIYGAPFINNNSKNKWFVDPSSTQVITHASNTQAFTQPNNPNPQSSSQVNVFSSGISLNYPFDCPAYSSSTGGGGGGSKSQKLAVMNNYITNLRATNSEGKNNFEIQSTVSSKLNLFLIDEEPASKDSVITILSNNQGGMADADIQLVFAYLRKQDFTNATNKTNALASSRADWKALLLKLIDIEQDPQGAARITGNQNDITFLTAYANTEGKDGQATAQALLKFALGSTHSFPLVYPEFAGNGSRMMSPITEKTDTFVSIENSTIQLYPNPTQTGITIQQTGKGDGILTVQLRDLLGKVIFTNFITKQDKQYVSLSNLSNGIYILSISEANKDVIYQSKLVKQE